MMGALRVPPRCAARHGRMRCTLDDGHDDAPTWTAHSQVVAGGRWRWDHTGGRFESWANICDHCGNGFHPDTHAATKYCSKACSSTAQSRKYRGKAA